MKKYVSSVLTFAAIFSFSGYLANGQQSNIKQPVLSEKKNEGAVSRELVIPLHISAPGPTLQKASGPIIPGTPASTLQSGTVVTDKPVDDSGIRVKSDIATDKDSRNKSDIMISDGPVYRLSDQPDSRFSEVNEIQENLTHYQIERTTAGYVSILKSTEKNEPGISILQGIAPDSSEVENQSNVLTQPGNSSLKSTSADPPNLTPYQPSGWDNKLVISTVTATHTSSSPIFNTQTIYVDWAVINNGSVAVSSTFHSKLYVDDVLKSTWYTSSLAAGAWSYVQDYNIGNLTAGSHTIKIVVDSNAEIAETNESDNQYIRTITVYPEVNLTTYQPAGWDNKLVLSTASGSTTSTPVIFDTDNIYLDWSVANTRPYATTTTFYIDLYIDGIWKTAWSRSGLGANDYTIQLDYLVGKLAPGSHTFRLRIDMDGYIRETNEDDNEYSRTITIVNKNLLLYQRGGWDNKLVLSTVTGTGTSAPAFYNNQDIYVDWSVWNNGSAAVTETFHSRLYVDGVQKGYWYTAGLAANYTAYISDHSIGKLAIGNHTIQIVVDADGEVTESNEADNSYSRTIYVGPSYNLTPYQPGGWDNKLVLSTVTGTNTSASVFYDTQDIYVDWACLNDALNDFTTTFYIRLYIDGVAGGAWTKAGLAHNTFTWSADHNLGKLAAGAHTIRLVVDSDGDVAESDETDNEYTRTITVVNKNLLPYQPAGWGDKIILSTVTGTNTSASSFCEGQNIYLDYAVHNNGSAAISETFYVRLYIDGVSKATWTRTGLGANTYYTIQDYSLGTLPAGTHTARIVADVLDNVTETSEVDNEYTRTFTVSTCKNLKPYQPPAWDNALVLSTVTGTHTSATTFNTSQVIYADWAAINDGANSITESFTVKLYVDGSLKNTWTRTGLDAGVYLYYQDFSAGMLPAGNHTFRIVTDADGAVTETNESDNEYTRTITVSIEIPPAPTIGTITQPSCTVATGSVVLDNLPATGTWTVNGTPGGIVKTGSGTSTTISGLAAGTTYTFTVTNSAGGTSPASENVVINPQPQVPAQPGFISGETTVCSGSTETYTISAVTGATSYTWTLPSGWTGSSTTTSITVTAGTAGGTISVTANNSCGSSPQRTLAVTVTSIPAQPGSITGSTTVCSGSTETYTISAVTGATSYTWSLPSGWTGSSTTTSITVTAGTAGGTISVTANSSCGSSPQRTLAVTGTSIPAQPGSITGSSTVCSGSTETYTISAVTGATSYTWSLPSGWTGSSTTTSITVTAGTAGGTISVTANNSCGSSPQRTLAVTVTSIPAQPGSITGSTTVCSGSSETYSISAVTGATSYTWSLPSGWTGSSTTTSITVTAGTAGSTISVTANNSCGSSPQRTLAISIATLPIVTTASVTSLSESTATGGGNITSNGGSAITEAGVCWSTSPNPSVSDSKITAGVTSGPFTCTITSLTNGVTYHMRAYATNCAGTAYGSDIEYRHSATDITDIQAAGISIYPNPVSEILTIKYSTDQFDRVNIYDSSGGFLTSSKVVIPTQYIDLQRFMPGLYIIEFVNKSGETKRLKLIKD